MLLTIKFKIQILYVTNNQNIAEIVNDKKVANNQNNQMVAEITLTMTMMMTMMFT